MSRSYPTESVDGFPTAPRTVTDREGRDIRVEELTPEEIEPLVEMYLTFSPEDRAQGIPPGTEGDIRDWLGMVTAEGINLVAWHDDRIVGHVILVGDRNDGFEVAIFVLQAYQNAGIGTALMKTVLGQGQEAGIEKVWLTVERWNEPAINLYEKIGFETTDSASFELEMALRLASTAG